MVQMTVKQAFELAVQRHQAGQLPQAEALYRQILQHQPAHAEALHMLGVILYQGGQREAAAELIRQALALRPGYAEAYTNLGTVLKELGNLDEALKITREAAALNPDSAEITFNLGNILVEAKNFEEGVAAYRRVLTIRPNFPNASFCLGNALATTGNYPAAVVEYRRALELRSDHAEAWNNLAYALKKTGFFQEALAACRRAMEAKPAYAEAYVNLGEILQNQGHLDEAIRAFRQSGEINPRYKEAYNSLGLAFSSKGQLDEAIAAYHKALDLDPSYAEAHNNLGTARVGKGLVNEAIAAYRQAIAVKPEFVEARSNLIYCLYFLPGSGGSRLALESGRWLEGREGIGKAFATAHRNDHSPDRRLRIGYVSSDFRMHSAAFFFLPLLEAHDHEHFHITCYSAGVRSDGITERMRALTDQWRSLAGVPDEACVERIRADGIDILVDLSGHTSGNRMSVFSRKPAPVQVTYLGFPGTTGLRAMDYWLTDAWADPVQEGDGHCVERLFRLPVCAWCFSPLSGDPDVVDLPLLKNGFVTFGSFNALAKTTPQVIDVWAELLRDVEGSRLLLKDVGFSSPDTVKRIRDGFGSRGIEPGRIELMQREATQLEHLRKYEQVDIGLDTFPYNGTTTTCEALWMGVPVVALAGSAHVSRVGVSLLTNLGMPELVGASMEQYVAIARDLAKDRNRLATLRSSLRGRMRNSVLMDKTGIAQRVESAYREMRREWCERAVRE